MPIAAQAAVDAINKSGGINGQQLKLNVCDNHADPNQSVACAQQQVAAGTVAFVGNYDTGCALTQPLYDKASIIGIESLPVCGQVLSSKYSFMLDAASTGNSLAYGEMLKKHKAKTAVVLLTAQTANFFANQTVNLVLKRAGIKNLGVVPVSPTTTDFTSLALKLKQINADAVVGVISYALTAGIIKADATVGYSPLFISTVNQFGEAQFAELGSLVDNGKVLLASAQPSPRDTSFKWIRLFNSEMTAEGQAPDDFTNRKGTAIQAWLAVHAFANVAKTIKGEITPQSVYAAISKLKTVNVDGFIWHPNAKGPAVYPRISNGLMYVLIDKGGHYAPAPGFPKQGFDALKAVGLTH